MTNQDFKDWSSSGTSSGDARSTSMRDDPERSRSEAGRQGAAASGSSEGARSLGEEARHRASRYMEDSKGAVTEHLETFAQAIRRASDELSEKDQTMAAQLVRQAAGGLESMSRSIDGASMHDMLESIRSFGRRNPTAFLGAAMLAGLALARFARASTRHEEGGPDWDRGHDADRYSGESSRAESGGGWPERTAGTEALNPSPTASYPTGERSSFAPATHGGADTPPRGQGYAGAGMRSDSSQSSATPSSETDASVTSSSFSGGSAQDGSISTGEP